MRRSFSRFTALPAVMILTLAGCALFPDGRSSWTVPPAPADITGRLLLGNGLDVRFLPDPSTPLVATLVVVRTGYASEDAQNSGYSHLLEHLVFAGTATRSKERIQAEIREVGGYINGFTRDDYTAYVVVTHRDHLARQLEVLSDMLFSSQLEEKAVNEARSVVLEEIRRRASRPETRFEEVFQELLYEGSPYARTGLGNAATVSSVSRQAVLDYYRGTYRPNNMVLLVAGGVEPTVAEESVKAAFGAAPPGPVPQKAPAPPPLAGRQVYSLRSALPDVRLALGFVGPDPRSGDAEAMEALGEAAGGAGGLIEAALKEKGFTPRSVSSGLTVNSGFSRFTITASFAAGTDGQAALASMLSAVDRLASVIPEDRFREARDALAAGEIMGRERIHYFLMGKVPWVLAGPVGGGMSPHRWDHLVGADLSRAAGRYLSGRPYAALIALPEAADPEAKAGGGRGVVTRVLENGLTVVAEQRPGSEVFAFHLMTRQRSAAEPSGKSGIADFLSRLLPYGTAERSAAQVDAQVRALGISLSTAGNPMVPFGDFYTSRTYSYVRLECLADRADRALALTADLVRRPRLSPSDVEEVRGRMLDFIAYKERAPDSAASRALAGALYGEALAVDVLGDRESVTAISREDLAAFAASYFTGSNLVASVVSGFAPDDAIAMVRRHFEGLPAGSPPHQPDLAVTTVPSRITIDLGLPQGSLAVGAVTGEMPAQDRNAADIAASLLNQRLYEQLREKEGLAYSVGAGLIEIGGKAVFTLSMGTSPEKMEQALSSVRREVQAAREMKVSPQDLSREINGRVGLLQTRMLSSINRAFYLCLFARDGLDHAFGEDYRARLLALTPGDVERAAARYFPGGPMVEVIVK